MQLSLPGTIRNPDLREAMPCIVLNLSSGGAKLQVDDSNYVPDTFVLEVKDRDVSVSCVVDWRGNAEVGVLFEIVRL